MTSVPSFNFVSTNRSPLFSERARSNGFKSSLFISGTLKVVFPSFSMALFAYLNIRFEVNTALKIFNNIYGIGMEKLLAFVLIFTFIMSSLNGDEYFFAFGRGNIDNLPVYFIFNRCNQQVNINILYVFFCFRNLSSDTRSNL